MAHCLYSGRWADGDGELGFDCVSYTAYTKDWADFFYDVFLEKEKSMAALLFQCLAHV